jgi:hypothetical protein
MILRLSETHEKGHLDHLLLRHEATIHDQLSASHV